MLEYFGYAGWAISLGGVVATMIQRGRFETQWRAENPLPDRTLQRLRAPRSGFFMPAEGMSEACRRLRRSTIRAFAVFLVGWCLGAISFAAMHAL